MSMPRGARPQAYLGLALSVGGILLALAGGGPVGMIVSYVGAFLLLVAAIAWGVTIGIKEADRDGPPSDAEMGTPPAP